MRPDPYAPYRSRVAANWPVDRLHQVVDATLLFADVSGFTALSERLAARGKVGSELLTDLLDAVFETLLDAALDRGGDLLAFGGDALCLLFTEAEHPDRAADTAIHLQRQLRTRTAAHEAIGRVSLGMSIGMEAGPIHFVRAGEAPHEYLTLGRTVTETLKYEGIANRGEIVVGPNLAGRLPAASVEDRGNVTMLERARSTSLVTRPADLPPSQTVLPGWLERVVDAGAEAEHRTATIGFVKLLGTDRLMESPESGAHEVDRAVREIQAITTRSGVTFLGADVYPDAVKVLLATGVPAASTDDAERMMEAALAIAALPTPLDVHIGVNSGRVFSGAVGSPRRRTYTVMGDTVNLAARLMARAESGAVVATDTTLGGIRRSYSRDELEPFMVKGKTKPIRASAVGRAVAGPPPAAATVIGRNAELGQLTELWGAARRGVGSSVEIVAAAGMGKSTLLDAFRGTVAAASVLVVAGGLYSRGSPYRALIPPLLARVGIDERIGEAEQGRQLVARISSVAPELEAWTPLLAIPFGIELPPTRETAAIAPQFRRSRLAELFVELLEVLAPEPTLVLVEDAHWIDDASAELLQATISAACDRPWLVVVSRRPVAEGPTFEGIRRTIALEPLSEAGARELISEIVRAPIPETTVQVLIGRAEGNPLLLAELTRAIAAGRAVDDLPESVESLASSEIDTLAAGDRRVLRRAAVLGATFPATMLEALAGEEYRGVTPLDRFLVQDGDQVRFRHALLRDAAYEGLTYRERVRLHGDTAERIERDAGAEAPEHAELLSLHHFHAHRWDPALRYSRIAGDRARSDLAPVEAAGFYRRALASARHCGTPHESRVALEASLAEVLERSGLYADARAALRRARRLTTDPITTAHLLLADGRIEECVGRYSQALRHYTRADRAVTAAPDEADAQSIRAQLAIERAGIRYRQGKYRECADSLRRELEDGVFVRASDAHRGRAHYLLDSALSDLGSAGAHAHAQQAITLLQRAGDLGGEASVWNNLGVEAYFDGELEESLAYYERCAALSREIGDVIQAATARNNIGEILSDRGDLDEAAQAFLDARRMFDGAGYAMGSGVAISNTGRLAVRRGEPEEASPHFDRAATVFATIGAASFGREVEGRRAEMLLALGRPADALSLIRRTLADAEAAGERAVLGEWLETLERQALADIAGSDTPRSGAPTDR